MVVGEKTDAMAMFHGVDIEMLVSYEAPPMLTNIDIEIVLRGNKELSVKIGKRNVDLNLSPQRQALTHQAKVPR